MNTYDLTLDLSKRGVIQTVQIRQGDTNGTTIAATITDHGVAASTSGLTARFQMRLPDGTHYYRKAASLSGNVATVVLDEAQAASVAGRTDVAYFQLLQGSTVVASTESFTVVVLPDALADAEVAESYDSAIQDAIDALDAAVADMPNMVEDVLEAHPEWTTTVQDGSITKAKLATDLARDRERLLYRLDNLLTAQLPEGETVTASDAARTPMAGLALYGRSTQDGTPTPSAPVAIESVGAFNMLDPADFVGGTSKGLTATYEGDGWIRVTGTVTGSAAGIVMLWGSADTSAAFLDSPSDRQSLLIEDDGVLAENAIGIQIYGRDGDGNNQYGIYYDAGLKLLPVGRYTSFLSRICLYLAASATGRVVDGRVRLTLVSGHWPLYQHVPYGSVGLLALGGNIVRGIDGEATLTKTSSSAQVVWGGDSDAALPHLKAGTTLTFTYEAKAGAAGTLTPYSGTRNDSNALVSSAGVDGAAVGPNWTTITRACTLERFADTMWLTASGTMPSGTEINVRNLRVTLDGSTDYQPYESTVTPIPLDGHELRSLPDGTRDEVTVDSRGHAVLVQRVQLTTQAVTDGVTGTVGVDVMSSTGAIANGATVLYKLATPVTHDLGTVDPVPLVGPDLTAQAVPTAPMQLTYERDLDATLARLESAIADVATS